MRSTLLVEPEDFLMTASGWFTLDTLQSERIREIEVLCRWFAKLQSIDIHLLYRDFRILQMAVEGLIIDPQLTAETATDIWDRFTIFGDVFGGRESEPKVRALFREARREVEGSLSGA